MGGSDASLRPGGSGDICGSASGGGGAEGERADAASGADNPGSGGATQDRATAGSYGTEVRPSDRGKRTPLDAHEIARACNEAISAGGREGYRKRAAAVLGITPEQLRDRIRDNASLRAFFSNNTDAEGVQPPTESEVLNRNSAHLPKADPSMVDLVDMVTHAERELHQVGLKNLGVPEKMLKRLKGLEGLASSTGHFIAQSLEVLCRSYYLQILELMEVAHDLRARLMIPSGQEGHISDDEARAYFNRNYVEMVKEAGHAFELMLMAAQAMVKMMVDTKGLEMPGGKKKKQGWEIIDAPKDKRPPPVPMPD
jgi:hypothetical protein